MGNGEGGEGRVQDGGTQIYLWLIHVNVWQKPPQYCKVISLQLKKKRKKKNLWSTQVAKSANPFKEHIFVPQLIVVNNDTKKKSIFPI